MSTAWLVGLLVVVFILGQLLMLRPNPREHALMLLRQAARRVGLEPRLVPVPEWLHYAPGPRLIACYILLVEGGRAGLPHWRIARAPSGVWETQVGADRQLERLLAGPLAPWQERLFAIEAGANAVSVWWLEDAAPDELATLKTLLETCRSEILGGL